MTENKGNTLLLSIRASEQVLEDMAADIELLREVHGAVLADDKKRAAFLQIFEIFRGMLESDADAVRAIFMQRPDFQQQSILDLIQGGDSTVDAIRRWLTQK